MSIGELSYQSLNLRLAAHPRVTTTDYTNDHVWEVGWGKEADEPLISAQTRYGGRVGLVRVVPLLRINEQSYYTVSDVDSQAKLEVMIPDAVVMSFDPWAQGIKARLLWWTRDSQTLQGRFHLVNTTRKRAKVDLQLFLQAMSAKQSLPIHQLELAASNETRHALALKGIPQVSPVLMLEKGSSTGQAALISSLEIEAGEEATLKWVLASHARQDDALQVAYDALSRSWTEDLKSLPQRFASIPQVKIGEKNDELEAVIALSINAVGQHIISPVGKFQHPFPVMIRSTNTYPKAMRPAAALEVLLYTSSLAVIDPILAQGIIRNYTRLQHSDAWIDGLMNPEGEGAGFLLMPILAQMCQIVDFYGDNKPFAMEIFIKLLGFYGYWIKQDADQDGFPEWQSLHQANYEYHPLSSLSIREAPPIDIRTLESPDLAAYLLREGMALKALSKKLGTKSLSLWKRQEAKDQALGEALMQSWQDGAFTYRDRDTNTPLRGQKWVTLKGDETLSESIILPSPNRMVVLVEGSQSAPPVNLAITLEGINAEGKATSETLLREQFAWHRSHYAATTQTLWQEVRATKILGLSRVYKYTLETVDMDRHDLSLLLPFMWADLPEEQRELMFKDLQDNYWHPFGLSSLSRQDSHYDRPDNNALHLVMPWVMMIGLALLENRQVAESVNLFKAVAAGIAKTLKTQGDFFQWYNVEEGTGLGLVNHVSGVLPLHWLMQLLGFYIRNEGEVLVWRHLAFKETVQVKCYGVVVTRSPQSMEIEFPSGHVATLKGKMRVQVVTDPSYQAPAQAPAAAPPPPPKTPSERVKVSSDRMIPEGGVWGEAD